MEKKYQWLLEIADRKPLLFSVALLLIAVGVLAGVVKERNTKLDKCQDYIKVVDTYYKAKMDSAIASHMHKEAQLEAEVKYTLQSIVNEYKARLEKQEQLNQEITFAINENKRIIKSKGR